ncbi:hypothetical protein QBC46DRAFT_408125 [Diplogelasinospora grovesii]|uniref:Uncharacterized protein n=1 Tax=Diplogelasinospora grovesii TaxID=303347 RepID=A0AAN6N7J2_9PEZI|nr:hypothetical protein QBC46DRAFT_408125 [Diplogelasinospora grovesii]
MPVINAETTTMAGSHAATNKVTVNSDEIYMTAVFVVVTQFIHLMIPICNYFSSSVHDHRIIRRLHVAQSFTIAPFLLNIYFIGASVTTNSATMLRASQAMCYLESLILQMIIPLAIHRDHGSVVSL